jgi:hypothetical protein
VPISRSVCGWSVPRESPLGCISFANIERPDAGSRRNVQILPASTRRCWRGAPGPLSCRLRRGPDVSNASSSGSRDCQVTGNCKCTSSRSTA